MSRRAALAVLLALGSGCSPSGGGPAVFELEAVSVQDGQVWPINRPITLRFSLPVDVSSVSLTTINVRQVGGTNATGDFFLSDPRTVVFQPTCPTQPDLSDAALVPGGVAYELVVLGADQGLGVTVRSTGGQGLAVSARRTFSTPVSNVPAELFFDPVVGPPRPVVRGRDGVSLSELDATYVEVGGDPAPATRLYFEDTGAGVVLRDAGGALAVMPLNLLSAAATDVAVVLFVDQPISPASADPASGAVRWEYEAGAGTWLSLASQTELLANCSATGAVLRSTPKGVLPPGTRVRVVLTTALADLTLDSNPADLNDFAVAPTAPSPAPLADELFEDFTIGLAESPTETLHDYSAVLADPPAVWGGGALSPGFDFAGTGGPGGNFDVRIPAGQFVSWSTISSVLVGGPDFVPAFQVVALGGVFDLDDLLIEPGATLRIDGPNPAVILATGRVDIQGTLDVSGGGNGGVNGLNTTSVPELGGAGQCGGGRGGTGSPLTNASSPRGGAGFGAFGFPDQGGGGGEAGWNCTMNAPDRRGAGGGGGVLGHDQLISSGQVDESWIGLNAEVGFPGSINANGAVGGQGVRPAGGAVGPGPFADGDPSNDFFGLLKDTLTGNVVVGELPAPWPGAGGGGGGDAAEITGGSCTWPDQPFDPGGDEKGAGGGGGAGALSILAIGPVVWGTGGMIRAKGGHGGPGESTINTNRIGAGGGGGSGGQVVIQSATAIDFAAKTSAAAGVPAILAAGGQGGAGANNNGGSSGTGETAPVDDACPDTSVPGCTFGPLVGTGGDGGPGIVQLHSPNGTIGPGGDIVVPGGVTLAEISFPAPLPPLIPQFGRTSRARSVWVPLGLGGFDPLDPASPIDATFTFAGTDPLSGAILSSGGTVLALPSILPETPPPVLADAPVLPYIAADGYTLVVDAASVPVELEHNPALLREYLIDLDPTGAPAGPSVARFPVASASYDAALDTLALTASMSGPPLTSAGAPGTLDVRVRPAFFRVETDGTPDSLPSSAEIQVQLQAAPRDPLSGGPDEGAASPWVSDASQLAVPGADWRFVRFEVFFDIDKNGQGIGPALPRPQLRFLRVPFRY